MCAPIEQAVEAELSRTHSLTHSLTHTHTLSHSHPLSLTHSHTHSRSLTHTHTLSLEQAAEAELRAFDMHTAYGTSLIRNSPPPLGPPQGPRHSPTVDLGGGAVSYERGTPVPIAQTSMRRQSCAPSTCTQHTVCLSLSNTHTHALSLSHTHSLSLSLTHTHSHTLGARGAFDMQTAYGLSLVLGAT